VDGKLERLVLLTWLLLLLSGVDARVWWLACREMQ
jgi:hypothetical protein